VYPPCSAALELLGIAFIDWALVLISGIAEVFDIWMLFPVQAAKFPHILIYRASSSQ